MDLHSTNYRNTFILVADDCPVQVGEIPPRRGNKITIARTLYEILNNNPYQFTSDEVLFAVYSKRKDRKEIDLEKERIMFLSKGQPCFRSSPLTKRYGWGIHCDENAKIAICGVETDKYKYFSSNQSLSIVKAMNSKRNKE